ncbi:hypothetical protein [Proteus phage vB_PmiP_RS8pmA]|uniref:Uncharacterized protein n=1 Tax=Proteus phage vB_PmiP_RS8pmA TaxID=2250314 RepID=A0A514CY73_9CAUD|nr:hypothetical protein [Proteus phage vB_PmiP_RS8pmA]
MSDFKTFPHYIKPHEFRELTNSLTSTAKKYKGCQSLREAIRATLQTQLNTLGIGVNNG